jgi:hypothetical protein
VPEIRNDFALVAVGEHGGLIGCTLVLALFLVLLHQGLRLAGRARDPIGFSVAFGLAFMIALQAAVNVAVVVALVPPKGISLPFVSYGGSSLLVNAVAVGLLASVAKDAKDTKHQSHRGLPDPGDPLQVPGLEHRAIIGSLHTPAAPGPEGLRFLRPPSTHPSFATESVS